MERSYASWLPWLRLPKTKPISKPFSAKLDFFRWFAAFLVCITHVRSPMLADYNPTVAHQPWVKLFYAVHGLGHEAVMIFFVLSGYLVGGEIIESFANGDFSWRDYGIRRIARLYTVYVPALVVGGLVDWLGLIVLPRSGFYTQNASIPMIFYNISERLDTATFAGNLLFSQGILVPTFGSNVPLWSLANEAWYYVLFPLALWPVFTITGNVKRCTSILVLAAIIWFIRGQILAYFVVWLIGLSPHFLSQPIFKRASMPITAAIAVMFSVRFRIVDESFTYAAHIALAILVALALNSLKYSSEEIPGARWHRTLASFSYSLYLLHWPLGLFLAAWIACNVNNNLRPELTISSLALYLGVIAFLYLFAWSFSLMTEKQTPKVKAFLKRVANPY